MAILIDTNVVLDWILDRQPFVEHASQIMEICIKGDAKGYLASHSITNIFYISRKQFSVDERKEILFMLCDSFEIIGLDVELLTKALNNENWLDLEDALQMQCAINHNLDYIITRDRSGFAQSEIKVVSPEEFLELT